MPHCWKSSDPRLLALAAAPAAAQNQCIADAGAGGAPQRRGPPLTFGITPAGEAGALGPAVSAVPDVARYGAGLRAARAAEAHRLREAVLVDALTGLGSHRAFHEDLLSQRAEPATV